MKTFSEKEIADLVINDEETIQDIVDKSKDTEHYNLWLYIERDNFDHLLDLNVRQCELCEEPKYGGINFGQKCLTRDQVFKKLLNCIES